MDPKPFKNWSRALVAAAAVVFTGATQVDAHVLDYTKRGHAHGAHQTSHQSTVRTYARQGHGGYVTYGHGTSGGAAAGCGVRTCQKEIKRPVCRRGELVDGVCLVVLERRLVCPPSFELRGETCVCPAFKRVVGGRCVGLDRGDREERDEVHGGGDNGGKDKGGKDRGGKDRGGKDRGGKDRGGRDRGGRDRGGKGRGGNGYADRGGNGNGGGGNGNGGGGNGNGGGGNGNGGGGNGNGGGGNGNGGGGNGNAGGGGGW